MVAGPNFAIPSPGDVIATKYVVERVLGVGGMGVVVAARHLQLGQRVAVKFMLAEALGASGAVARFMREARASVSLSSEHVAKVLDVGVLESGAPYMVMEYLDGIDLSEVLRRSGPMGISDAVGAVLQACEGVAEAHTRGIVHRDLKPANLFVARRIDGTPLVKVLDFGISKVNDTTSPSLTSTGSVMGSPLYMSPEQVRSAKNVDARSDIWSLGVILYELLAGAQPFVGETVGETFAKILSDPLPPLASQRPDVPAGLAAIVASCLERDLTKRTQSVADLATALLPFGPRDAAIGVARIQRIGGARESQVDGREAPFSAPAGADSPRAPRHGGGTTAEPLSRNLEDGAPPASRRGRAVIAMGAAAAALAVAGGLAVSFARLHRGPTVASEAPSLPSSIAVAETPPPPAPKTTAIDSPPRVSPEPDPAAAEPAPAGHVLLVPAAHATAIHVQTSGASHAPPSHPVASAPVSAPPAAPSPPAPGPSPLGPSASAPAAPVCRVVSYFDADGNKHFKQECK